MNKDNLYCAPPRKNEKSTCFNLKSLIKIAKEWNKEYPNNDIKIDNVGGGKKSDNVKKKLWRAIKKKLLGDKQCQHDYCLLEHPLVKKIKDGSIIYETFLPARPNDWDENPKSWLSTLDIRHVLLQYERTHPDFEFIGPEPIDFDQKIGNQCISEDLCRINLEKLYKKKKRKIGIVFNLDRHDQNGSHWVSLFIDLNNGGIFYFDSVGKPPKKEIKVLMEKIKKQGNQLLHKKKIDTDYFDRKYSIVFSPITIVNKNEIKINNISEDLSPSLEGMMLEFYCPNKTETKNRMVKKIKKNNIIIDKSIESSCKSVNLYGFRKFFNDFQHQFKDTECGVYSIYFISSILEGTSYEDIVKNIVNDYDMNKKRELYFRPSIKENDMDDISQ